MAKWLTAMQDQIIEIESAIIGQTSGFMELTPRSYLYDQ